jgi:hypothetical protein
VWSAVVTPPAATLPITYAWQATGQTPVVHAVNSLSDTASFAWTIGGTMIAADTHLVTLYSIYLPFVVRN